MNILYVVCVRATTHRPHRSKYMLNYYTTECVPPKYQWHSEQEGCTTNECSKRHKHKRMCNLCTLGRAVDQSHVHIHVYDAQNRDVSSSAAELAYNMHMPASM